MHKTQQQMSEGFWRTMKTRLSCFSGSKVKVTNEVTFPQNCTKRQKLYDRKRQCDTERDDATVVWVFRSNQRLRGDGWTLRLNPHESSPTLSATHAANGQQNAKDNDSNHDHWTNNCSRCRIATIVASVTVVVVICKRIHLRCKHHHNARVTDHLKNLI